MLSSHSAWIIEAFLVAIDGAWTAWSEWSPCMFTRRRCSNNSYPKAGGTHCHGVVYQIMSVFIMPKACPDKLSFI